MVRLPAKNRVAASNRTNASNRVASANRVAAGMLFSSTDGVGFGANDNDSRTPGYLATLRDTFGIGWVRIVFNWQAIEDVKGTFTWSGYDAVVNKAIALNLNVQGQISFVPPWCSSDPNSGDGTATKSHYAPSDYTAWLGFVSTVVNRYPSIKHWEIWNEPDSRAFWQTASGSGQAAAYAQLLSQSYDTIKGIDSTLSVSFGGIARAGSNYDASFFGSVINDATYPCKNKIDRACFHSYNLATMATTYNYVQGVLNSAGIGSVPIDCGESGYFSDGREQILSGFAGYQYGVAAQIAWIQAARTTLYGLGVARVFWFDCYDNYVNAQQFGQGTYGLMYSNGDPKITTPTAP